MNSIGRALFVCFCILSAVANSQQQKCGKELIAPQDTLSNPNYPFPLDVGTVCSWSFKVPETTAKLVNLNMEEVEIAEEDTLVIFDGIQTFYYNGVNVTSNLMVVLNGNGSTVQLNIGPNVTISPRNIMASYRSDGVPMYSQEHRGMIKSPMYSTRAGVSMNFTWIVTNKPATSIYLSFRSFNISSGRLTIKDNSQHLSFNGSDIPNDIATADANVEITLELPLGEPDLIVELFHAQLHPNCSRLIAVENATEIDVDFKDLEAASDYTVKCFIVVEGRKDIVFSAGVRALDAEIPESNTVITVNDGGSRHSTNLLLYSPSSQLDAPPEVLTSGNRLWIGYDSLAHKQPLNVSVHVTVHNSGQHLRDSGYFVLPKQTSSEPLATNTSMYVLSVASNQQVIATVDSNFSLSLNNSILFYDGTTKEKLLANFTLNTTFYPVVSTSNQLRIVANNFKGNDTFSASFVSAKKGANLLSSERLGSFQLNEVEANSSSMWIIAPLQMNSSVEVIALTITKASIDHKNSLTIYGGTRNTSAVLYTLTALTTNMVVYIDSAEGAKVVFQNNGNASSGVIIDASYQLQPKCQQSINLTSTNATTISTPNYPGLYPLNAQCRWNVTTPSEMVYLTFKSLNLPPSQPLLIYSTKGESLSLVKNISGSGIVDDVITDQAPLLLVWSSSIPLNNLTVFTGFQIELYPLDCGGSYNESGTKMFQTPNYPHPEKNSTFCVWAVTVPPKKDDKVDIIDLSFSTGDLKTSSANLMIHEGGSLQSPPANMSGINQTSFLSRENKLLIRYTYEADSTGGSSYKFTYQLHECNRTCDNQVCMHDAWRCNGINECGDFTDERECAASPVNPPAPPTPAGISVATFVVVMFVMLILGAVLAIGGPVAWRRFRSQRSYQEFRNTADA